MSSGGWPRSAGTMQAVRFAPPCTASDLESICNWAGLSFTARAHAGLPARALSRLVGIAARNSGTNSYHHHGHFAHVVMAAGVLAAMAGVRGPTAPCWFSPRLSMTSIIRGGGGRQAVLAGGPVGPHYMPRSAGAKRRCKARGAAWKYDPRHRVNRRPGTVVNNSLGQAGTYSDRRRHLRLGHV